MMRKLLIAGVVVLTGGTFYSALWHQSENIEDDISARVSDAVAAQGARDVAVDVDGRYVTLSGVVFDEAREQSLLQAADQTHGALGPIDGLVYQADTGFIAAQKTASGIILNGTVPSEDARAALVAQAQAATDGDVTDALTIAGAEADWQGEAVFGLSQLSELSAGTLTASAGTLSLSGVAQGDAAAVNDAVTARAGWSGFVMNAAQTGTVGQDDEVGRLRGVVGNLSGQLASRNGTIGRLRGDLEDSQAAVGRLNGQLASRNGTIGALRGALADLDEATTNATAQVAQTDTTSADDSQLDALRNQVADRDAAIGRLNGQLASRIGTVGNLRSQLADRDAVIGSLNGQLASRIGTLGELNSELADTRAAVGNLTGQLASRNGTIGALRADLENREAAIGRLNGQLASRIGSNGALTGQVADRDAAIGSLNGQLASRIGTLSGLRGQLADQDRVIGSLNGQLASRIGTIGALNSQLADRDATIAGLQGQAPTSVGASEATAQQCARQATLALTGSNINFATATATIEGSSVELLERLTGIALACVGEGLAVEVGGHTDADGSGEANQALSEQRAQAIVDFMTARGVSAQGLTAVGYGEDRPVADNETAEGRAANRRISFDWKAQ